MLQSIGFDRSVEVGLTNAVAFVHLLCFASLVLLTKPGVVALRISGWLAAVVLASGMVFGADLLNDLGNPSMVGWTALASAPTSLGFVLFGGSVLLQVAPTLRSWRNDGTISRFFIWKYLVVFLTAAFVVDQRLPQDVAMGLLYSLVVIFAWFAHERRTFFYTAGICTALIAVDTLTGADALENTWIYTRIIAIVSVWVSAFILYFLRTNREELTSSEARFRSIFEASWEGIIVMNEKSEIVMVNGKLNQMLGYTKNELIGCPMDSVLPQFFNIVKLDRTDDILSEETSSAEFGADNHLVALKKDGSRFPAKVRLSDFSHGHQHFTSVSLSDITDVLRGKEELQDSLKKLKDAEFRFKSIFNNAYQFIGLLEPDGTLVEANETALQFAGVSIDDVRGKKFWDTPWWSISNEVKQQMKEAIGQAGKGEFVRYDVDNLGADGSILTVDFSLRPIFDEHGTVIYLVPEGRDISNRRTLENKLVANEKLLQQFVKHTPNAVAMFNNSLEYMVASDAWYKDYGIEGRQIIGMHHYDVFPEIRQMPHWQELHQRALLGELIREDRDAFIRHDGHTDWLRYVIQPWMDENQRIGGIIMFTEVITEQVELEKNLEKREKEFRTIFETIDEGIVYQNKNGEITNANAAAERILGLSLDQMRGVKSIDPRWKALHEDGTEFPGEEHPAMVALRTGQEQRNVIQGIFHPGKQQHIWISANSYPILDEVTGEVHQVYSTFEDITDEYNAKKALEWSEQRFNLAVQGTTAGVWDWIDLNGDEEWWSPKFYDLLGYQVGEIEPSLTTFGQLLHPDDSDLTFKMVDRHLKRKTPFVVEYRLKHRSGKYRWFLGSGQATWDHEGNPIRMVGTIVDIHARKMAEEAEVQHARDLADKNKELEEFTYVASHDLQEPVRTISSFVELFRETYGDKLDAEALKWLELMQGASERSQKLIIDLLEYSRLGRKREFAAVNLNNLLDDVRNDLGLRITESKPRVLVDQLPTLQGLETELRLLFQNLISNAIKFRKHGVDPIVHVRYHEEENNHHISVSDNGIGIDEKFFDQIFVIFRRLHSKSEYGGTAIGLAHCKKVVELHHGKIWLDSVVEKGTTFHISFPMDHSEHKNAE